MLQKCHKKLCEAYAKFGIILAYIIDRCHHVSSAGASSPAPIIPFSFPEPRVNVVNGAFAADESLKVLFHLGPKWNACTRRCIL